MYADNRDEFHRLVLTACELSDNLSVPSNAIVDEKPTVAEERVHELQTEISHTVLGTMQATETLETP